MTVFFNPFFTFGPSSKELIAPSKNSLDDDAKRNRRSIALSTTDQKVEQILAEYQLKMPKTFVDASSSDHCVSMSLKFIQHYQQSGDVAVAAKKMAPGADKSCAEATILYHSLFEDQARDITTLKRATARFMGLSCSKEVILKMPVEALSAHLGQLEKGEYLLVLPGHVVTLLKNSKGMFLFDPDRGSYPVDEAALSKVLLANQVHLSEQLTLLSVSKEPVPFEREEKVSPEFLEKPVLKIEKGQGKWEKVTFSWRDKTHQFIKDCHSHAIYNSDSKWIIRFKCALLIPGTIVAAVARTIYHIAMSLFHVSALPFYGTQNIGKAGIAFINAFRAPFYGILGVGAALYGIIKPYEGRSLYGYLERSLNHQNQKVNRKSAFYMAQCFTPLNFNAADRRNEEMTVSQLKKYVLWKKHILKKFRKE